MADPQTSNVGLEIPLRGADVGTWDLPVNGDFSAIDGMLGGVQTVGLSSAPVTLTSPYSVNSPNPGPGPTQAQNAVIIFTGALSANVTVTLPIPCVQVVKNNTTGNFLVTLRAVGSGDVIAVPQGVTCRIYNDGTNVAFIEGIEGRPGKMEFEGGETTLPAWMAACTKRPFLLCDGSIYNFSDYPALGAKYGSKFGGNGITTFGVQDMRGRVPLAYDGTGTRITSAGCGIDGQTIGASGGSQNFTMTLANLIQHDHTVFLYDTGHGHSTDALKGGQVGSNNPGGVSPSQGGATVYSNTTGITLWSEGPNSGSQNKVGKTGNATPTPMPTVLPAQVAGIWLVKT